MLAPSPSREGAGWTRMRVTVVALCFVLNMLDGADLLVMSFIAPVLSAGWAIGPEKLGLLFSASLAGMAVGCVLVAPLADRWGRRTMILAALALVGIAMIASGFTRSVPQFALARFLVGIGVGTIGVSMTATAAEFAPPRHAAFAVGLVQAGWPFASIGTALVLARLLPAIGWQAPMIAIGVLSFVVLAIAAAVLPESPALPAVRGRATRGPRALFGVGMAVRSILLWVAVTLCYFDLYFVISWIPKLATQAGLALDDAIYAGATFNLGAFLGTAAIGVLAIRHRLDRLIPAFLVAGAGAMILFGAATLPVVATLVVAMAIGVSVQGGFNGFWGLAAQLYPPDIRGLGVGWALGFGRIGAVLGPIVGGQLVGRGISIAMIFTLFACPLLVAAAVTTRIDPRRRAA